ncbi:hypothetical protein [Mycoplasmopsis columbinasalis]|uniref:Uncharacterized protein n=1 Tax=Mycoplasmopsis columbinasalis TaxID=114880 RepID=A0A449BAA0_9BACT|nr:hypothetical protein [Mycoplasmopsis columbinasalis]VEU78131.1 Uncharacterised protein [Mycoplasmopsis columbinasalis]
MFSNKKLLLFAHQELHQICQKNECFLTLSPDSFLQLQKNPNLPLEKIRYSLYWADYFFLASNHQNQFMAQDKTAESTSLVHLFKYENQKIYLDLIFPTTPQQYHDLMLRKNRKRMELAYSHSKTLSQKIKFFRTKPMDMNDFVKIILNTRYEGFLIQGENFNNYRFYEDLNPNFVNTIKQYDLVYNYFKIFEKDIKNK